MKEVGYSVGYCSRENLEFFRSSRVMKLFTRAKRDSPLSMHLVLLLEEETKAHLLHNDFLND